MFHGQNILISADLIKHQESPVYFGRQYSNRSHSILFDLSELDSKGECDRVVALISCGGKDVYQYTLDYDKSNKMALLLVQYTFSHFCDAQVFITLKGYKGREEKFSTLVRGYFDTSFYSPFDDIVLSNNIMKDLNGRKIYYQLQIDDQDVLVRMDNKEERKYNRLVIHIGNIYNALTRVNEEDKKLYFIGCFRRGKENNYILGSYDSTMNQVIFPIDRTKISGRYTFTLLSLEGYVSNVDNSYAFYSSNDIAVIL